MLPLPPGGNLPVIKVISGLQAEKRSRPFRYFILSVFLSKRMSAFHFSLLTRLGQPNLVFHCAAHRHMVCLERGCPASGHMEDVSNTASPSNGPKKEPQSRSDRMVPTMWIGEILEPGSRAAAKGRSLVRIGGITMNGVEESGNRVAEPPQKAEVWSGSEESQR